ncbi:MAG: GH92 family glycosyl hydrolase [Bacteroidales bacterium]|nr:GH92 family glycosyl hydrolase [Bacteroidales bacterium]
MIKQLLPIILTFTLLACQGGKSSEGQSTDSKNEIFNLVDYVNPLVGTESSYKLSHGNTYPAIATPWGMNFWTPQTGRMGNGWAYTYQADKLVGIKQTHQPSPWINDYGAFSLMALTGELKVDEMERSSRFSHAKEISKPYYYYVFMDDYQISTEVTPTDRAACFRFTFPKSDSSWILLDAFNEGSYIRVIPEKRKIIGYAMNNSGGVPENFANYFVAVFDKDFVEVGTWSEGALQFDVDEAESDHVGAFIRFITKPGESIGVKVASSFIGAEQAELNLKREIGERSFETVEQIAKEYWNRLMNRVVVEDYGKSTGIENQDDAGIGRDRVRTFYTALYRTMLFPRKFYELNASNQIVHYSPYNGKVLPGYMFTDNGFWDTFRAVFPFFTLVYPDMNSKMMQGLVNTYKESGWLPEWASPGHRNCMIGSNSASLIADSYIKGIRGYDIEILWQAVMKNTKLEGPLTSVGREGVDYYNKLGYIPYDVGINENAARTLEYAYDDFAIWRLAKALKKPKKVQELFKARAQNYRNLFDRSTNFMRGKNEDGSWQSPFVPEAWGGAFTEGSSWHYTWSVFQDPQGLIDLMGGREAFVSKLDSVFTMDPIFDYSYYGFEIHEITEMVNAGMGQYAHGNQPIQHAIYLYDYAGEPWKTQQRVREVMDKLYSADPDGLCGDEDNGQTSAWYVFSAMGFYPVCPGTPQYVIGSPLFEKVTLNLENGKTFVIRSENNSTDNVFIRQVKLNGKSYRKNYLQHRKIHDGGSITFYMDSVPNKKRGIDHKDAPYSMAR